MANAKQREFNTTLGKLCFGYDDPGRMVSMLCGADPLMRDELLRHLSLEPGECVQIIVQEETLCDKNFYAQLSRLLWSICESRSELAMLPACTEHVRELMYDPASEQLLRRQIEDVFYSTKDLSIRVAQNPDLTTELHSFLMKHVSFAQVPAERSPFVQVQLIDLD